MGGVRWAGSEVTGPEVQISRGFRSDGQGVQVRWVGGFRSVSQGQVVGLGVESCGEGDI